jgi:hypothetical protein
MASGLANIIKAGLPSVLEESDGPADFGLDVELEIKYMTDKEVAELPDV